MIPLGNWQDRIDELESENHDLTQKNSELEEEIAVNLAEIDLLRDRVSELDARRGKLLAELRDEQALTHRLNAEIRGWEGVAECARERAEKAETDRDDWKARAWKAETHIKWWADDASKWKAIGAKATARAENAEEALQAERAMARHNMEQADRDFAHLDARTADNYGKLQEVQKRANSWFEVAKTQVRARDFWIGQADMWADQADKLAERVIKSEEVFEEMKAALRVLGGKKE